MKLPASTVLLLLAVLAPVRAANPPSAPAIQVPPGFEVVPVALSPLVSFPMLGNFDERGRLFVAENAGVNLDEKALDQQLPSRIRMLEDIDGDGVFDRSSIFADRLAFPQGALWHDGALYVTSAPSLWRLEDKDGDGRADSRIEIATGFKSTGNAADVHGPFLHPNGRLYWCHGRKGHEVYQNGGGALVSKALGARIWSCRPDGTDIQVHAGGGMDNPVELAFNQEGEMFGTANIVQGTPRADAIIHWIHGGVYPRTDQESALAEFRRTGELLPPITFIGHVAPAGIALPRSGQWPAEYRGNLFYAEFDTHRIMRVPLERNGSTYRGRPQAFATTSDSNVHFTDVIEDADGSLLVIDTGPWFRRGCPSSIVARADITGGIYRIRPKSATAPADPRGKKLDWDRAAPEALVPLLGDPRVAVRDRAVTILAKRGDAGLPALAAAVGHTEYLIKSNAIWALTRIGTAAAQAAVRNGLLDLDARIREAACQSAFVTTDRDAAETLVAKLGDDSLSVQREAARALGRLRNAAVIPALGGAAALPRDPMLTHALVYALIEIDAPAETRRLLAHREPLARRAALIALDQSAHGRLEAAEAFAALPSKNEPLRSAALDIVVRHPDWSRAAADFLAAHKADAGGPADDVVSRLLNAFLSAAEVRAWAQSRLAGPRPLDRSLILEALAASPKAWDESWREFLNDALRSAKPAETVAALRAVATHRSHDFSSVLRSVGQDKTRPTSVRVTALQLAAGGSNALDSASFQMLLEPLQAGGSAEGRLQAATVLKSAKLNREQLLQLADVLPAASPLEVQQLIGAFQAGPADATVAARLLERLQQSNGRWGVQQATLHAVFQRYPEPAHENAAPLITEIVNQNVARADRVTELEQSTKTGDPTRGRAAFLANTGACFACHRVGESGGTVGPDLTHIGRIRSTRDLIESISFPDSTIAQGYESSQVSTRDGRTLLGRVRESGDTVIVVTPDGQETAVLRSTIAKLEPMTTSLMPPGLDRVLDPKDFADLVAFLKSLQ